MKTILSVSLVFLGISVIFYVFYVFSILKKGLKADNVLQKDLKKLVPIFAPPHTLIFFKSQFEKLMQSQL